MSRAAHRTQSVTRTCSGGGQVERRMMIRWSALQWYDNYSTTWLLWHVM